eukprot:TRINITY_DN27146_c0_g1_i1.p1 TRINITY_DN27146_c0_g1~~TRINITY_DN27146_c0_g1_i1.p1  ORF type:complete len:1336 (-),score=283.60 TRINITY_DN27146_c0_g1_i1:427-4434(-)
MDNPGFGPIEISNTDLMHSSGPNTNDRMRMTETIHRILSQSSHTGNARQKGVDIGKYAAYFENIFYQRARSRDDYVNPETIMARISSIVREDKRRRGMIEPRKMMDVASINPVLAKENKKRPAPPVQQPVSDRQRDLLKRQQERLILLDHARHCRNPSCTFHPECAYYQRLNPHIMNCVDVNCAKAHCLSSRHILKHYSGCPDRSECKICSPLHQIILRRQRQKGIMRSNSSTGPDATENHLTPLNSFSHFLLRRHIDSIRAFDPFLPPSKLRQYLSPIIKDITELQSAKFFMNRVNEEEDEAPGYYNIIKEPISLGEIKNKVTSFRYRKFEEFCYDMELVFKNCAAYTTSEEHWIRKQAKEVEDIWDLKKKEIENRLNNHRLECTDPTQQCALCHGVELKFEPPIFYCNGTCDNNRIRRSAPYYQPRLNRNIHWCVSCFENNKSTAMEVNGVKYEKEDCEKIKKSVNEQEPWVQCDQCSKWYHQICVLYNPKRDRQKSTKQPTKFCCPLCWLEREDINMRPNAPAQKDLAKSLKPTMMSEFMIRMIQNHFLEAAERFTNDPANEGRTFDIIDFEKLSIRVMSAADRTCMVHKGFKERYKSQTELNLDAGYAHRSKCIAVFHNIDGVDVCIFVMYVQEYNHRCEGPNKRAVYISYLDSVKYFNPASQRTLLYQGIIKSYLQYVKCMGFYKAYIWACPPTKGDDYILYCHPEDQKTPRADRLREWYITLLCDCMVSGDSIANVRDFYSEHFDKPGATLLDVPYMDGDYWPGLTEEVIRKLKDGEDNKSGNVSSKNKKNKGKKKNNKRAKRNGNDGDEKECDAVFEKVAATIKDMTQDFFVVHIRPACNACNHVIENGEILHTCDTCKKDSETDLQDVVDKGKPRSLKASKHILRIDHEPYYLCDNCFKACAHEHQHEDSHFSNEVVKEIRDCTDNDPVYPSQIFDTRHDFLAWCQTNHNQFDQLRRAKYSSMMILYHVANPMTAAFIYSCALCHETIENVRYYCKDCADYNLCETCYKRNSSNLSELHEHKLIEDKLDPRTMLLKAVRALEHAASCKNDDCKEPDCNSTKTRIAHALSCDSKKSKEGDVCTICKVYDDMLREHANHCKVKDCPVPRCNDVREENIRRSNRLMNERLRQATTDRSSPAPQAVTPQPSTPSKMSSTPIQQQQNPRTVANESVISATHTPANVSPIPSLNSNPVVNRNDIMMPNSITPTTAIPISQMPISSTSDTGGSKMMFTIPQNRHFIQHQQRQSLVSSARPMVQMPMIHNNGQVVSSIPTHSLTMGISMPSTVQQVQPNVIHHHQQYPPMLNRVHHPFANLHQLQTPQQQNPQTK